MKEKLLVEELTSLKLIGVPEEFNNKDFLRNFYEKFGTVKRVYSHPVSNSAIITFIDHVRMFCICYYPLEGQYHLVVCLENWWYCSQGAHKL